MALRKITLQAKANDLLTKWFFWVQTR